VLSLPSHDGRSHANFAVFVAATRSPRRRMRAKQASRLNAVDGSGIVSERIFRG
jgi:hypothetical protein